MFADCSPSSAPFAELKKNISSVRNKGRHNAQQCSFINCVDLINRFISSAPDHLSRLNRGKKLGIIFLDDRTIAVNSNKLSSIFEESRSGLNKKLANTLGYVPYSGKETRFAILKDVKLGRNWRLRHKPEELKSNDLSLYNKYHYNDPEAVCHNVQQHQITAVEEIPQASPEVADVLFMDDMYYRYMLTSHYDTHSYIFDI